MNKNISFKFEFETEDAQVAHDFLPKILQKIKHLQTLNKQFLNIEVSLSKSSHLPHARTAILTIHLPEGVIREETKENDWHQAIDIVFNNVAASIDHALKVD
jgi:ribosome-associated translation inhibitor RaiA